MNTVTTLDVRLPAEDAVSTVRYAIILLRLSDFRDEDDDATFGRREEELRELAAGLHLTVPPWGVVIENEDDLRNDGKLKSASAYKTPRRVTTADGIITRRTDRPKFTQILVALQERRAAVLIAGDESRLSRNWRDGNDLLDVCASSGASVVVPDEDGGAKWVLTNGGTAREKEAFMDEVDDARKYSQAVAARVRKGRKRWVGRSWQGGRRPFGFQIAKSTEEHQRNLVIDEREAAVLRHAADALDHGGTLRALARELKTATGDAFVPTLSGAEWNGSILRNVLAKPATAGLAVRRVKRGEQEVTELIPAPWPAIIERPQWERLRALFESNGPGRGNEPRWLLSVIARCGVCDDGTTMKVRGSGTRRSYVCLEYGHLRRNADKVEELVTARILALLERDAPDLLKPQPRVTAADTGKLREEAAKLRTRKTKLGEMYAAGRIDDDALASGTQVIRDRLAAIDAELSASDQVDPLPEFRDLDPDADLLAVWDGLGIVRQRAVVRLLYDIVIMPVTRKAGPVFDPDSVIIRRRT